MSRKKKIDLSDKTDTEAELLIRQYCNKFCKEWGSVTSQQISKRFKPRELAVKLFKERVVTPSHSSPETF